MPDIPHLGEKLYTSPAALRDLVSRETLAAPGNLVVSDAINFVDEMGVDPDGQPLDNDRIYALNSLAVQSKIYSGKVGNILLPPQPISFHVIEGDPETQGTAVAAVVGDLDEIRKNPEGALTRFHSRCAYSEIGRLLAEELLVYDPGVLYDRADELMPSFIEYGDGIISSFPFRDDIERSTDCDCCPQRRLSQFFIGAMTGIFVSMTGKAGLKDPHEGRGVGLLKKGEIYDEQERQRLAGEPVDTVAACDTLGLPHDTRNYDHAVDYIADVLRVKKIRLLSNNERKVEAARRRLQVEPFGLVPAWLTEEAHNYVNVKRERLGHKLDRRATLSFDNFGNPFLKNVKIDFTNPEDFASSVIIPGDDHPVI